ncbi:MAG TPA: ATP-binding protein, partial [Alphaproteobacteria bacterium]|nr:ATP-binding protein [Alphaproteobacteria bacterium]
LLMAQRKAAWADVARRIAHEVKNPLTPIQLSAERLKRRYQKYIISDVDIFDQCIDTIVNQVDTIKRLIDEFSAFARMPTPIFQYENLVNVCKQAVFLQSQGHQDIVFDTYFLEPVIMMKIDSRQIGQALTNVLLNAVQAIEKLRQQKPDSEQGHIALTVEETSNKIVIAVEDNGCGLPEKYLDILTEPYVTTKANGTGLGLAIVRKIVEDHKGILKLGNKDSNKTLVEFEFDKQENMLLD